MNPGSPCPLLGHTDKCTDLDTQPKYNHGGKRLGLGYSSKLFSGSNAVGFLWAERLNF